MRILTLVLLATLLLSTPVSAQPAPPGENVPPKTELVEEVVAEEAESLPTEPEVDDEVVEEVVVEEAESQPSEPETTEELVEEVVAEEAESLPTEPEDDDVATDEVEYTYEAVTVAERIPVDPFESARSVVVKDAEVLAEEAPRTVPEALWGAPGVFVQQTNHGGGSPILRGMIGPQNLILIDGVRLNNSVYRTGPLQYLNLIDPLSVSGIEVLRGPGSVLYGSDAMGGVIQVTPISPRRCCGTTELGSEAEALLRYGSASRQRTVHVDGSGGLGGASLLAGITYTALDDLTGGRNTGLQLHSGYDQVSAIGRLTYEITSGDLMGSTASLGYLLTRIWDAGRTDKLYDKNSLQLYDNFDDLVYGRFHLRLRPIDTDANLTLSYQRFFEQKENITVDDDYITEVSTTTDETRADTIGVDLQMDTWLIGRRFRLQYGGMWYHDSVGAERWTRSAGESWQASSIVSYPNDSTYDNYGAFLIAEGEPVSTETGHTLRLGGGYRFHGMTGYAPAQGDLAEVEFSDTGHVVMTTLQYVYRDYATAAFTFSQGFRAPNLQEAVQLGDTGKYFHIPNDDLGPERSDTFELLARGRLCRITAGVSGYVSLLHDLIRREETTWEGQTEVDGKAVAWNINGGEGLLLGVEGEVAVDLGSGFSVAGNLTYTWGEEDVPDGDGIPLTRIPPLFGQATVRYDTPFSWGWMGFIETYVRGAAEQDRLSVEDEKDVRIPDGGTPGWWTWNIRAGMTVYDHLQVGLSVENLLDEDYKYHGSGVFAAGTNAVLTIRGFY